MRAYGCDISEYSSPALGALPRVSLPFSAHDLIRNLKLGVAAADLKIYDYAEGCRLMEADRPTHPHLRGFFVGWDNTPRRGRKAIILINATPEAFAQGLRVVIESMRDQPANRRILFINAWNEWAEGMCLEPDQRYGHGFLQALRDELTRTAGSPID